MVEIYNEGVRDLLRECARPPPDGARAAAFELVAPEADGAEARALRAGGASADGAADDGADGGPKLDVRMLPGWGVGVPGATCVVSLSLASCSRARSALARLSLRTLASLRAHARLGLALASHTFARAAPCASARRPRSRPRWRSARGLAAQGAPTARARTRTSRRG